MSVAWTLRRNGDPALPASHLLELTFATSPEIEGGGTIQTVPGMLVKSSEEARGKRIEGLAVKISTGSFLVGFSITDVHSNEALLKEGKWFDIPIVYDNGNRAMLALEKGSAGERAFDEVFSAWATTASASHEPTGVVPPPCTPLRYHR